MRHSDESTANRSGKSHKNLIPVDLIDLLDRAKISEDQAIERLGLDHYSTWWRWKKAGRAPPMAVAILEAIIPVVGTIGAGPWREAIATHVEEWVELVAERRGRDFFALRVVGDSMISRGILPGDVIVLCKDPDPPSGSAVVVLDQDHATLKRLQKQGPGKVWLEGDGGTMPFPVDAEVIGRVDGLVRKKV